MENKWVPARGLLLCKITLLLGICATAMPVRAQEKTQVPALKGYCPASYLLSGEAVKGKAAHQSTHAGKTYYFADENAKKAFDGDPEKYLPQFGGMCTVSLGGTYGNRFESDPASFQVVDGKVYLFVSQRAIRAFTKKPQHYISGAEEVFKSQPADAPVRKLGDLGKRAPGAARGSSTDLLGKLVPDAVFALPDGTEVRARDMKDDATLLTFYTTWCGFCKRALPQIDTIAKSLEDQSPRFLCVNMDTLAREGRESPRSPSKKQVLNHWKELGLTMPQAFDFKRDAAGKLLVQSFPTMFLLGKTGKVERIYRGAGAVADGSLKKDMESLLAGKTLAASRAPAARKKRERPAMKLAGKPAPKSNFTVAADGSTMSLTDTGAEATLALFYTSWCGYCKKAIPKLSELAESYEGKPVRFVGVNQDKLVDQPDPKNSRAKTKEQVIKQWQDLGVTFPQVFDPASVGRNEFKVVSFPTMFLIDKAGNVDKVYVGSGAVTNGALRRDIESLLGARSGSVRREAIR